MVKARSQFKERSTATNVEIEVHVRSDATNPNIRTLMGSAAYAPERDAMVWKVKSFLVARSPHGENVVGWIPADKSNFSSFSPL
ncbi:unnamed protein product [Urochloa humidicola]